MKFDRLKKVNFSYIIGEIILIIVGVSISLFIDEKIKQRNEWNIESKYLSELRESLVTDTMRIGMCLRSSELTIRSINFCVSYFGNRKEVSDSVLRSLADMTTYRLYEADDSPIIQLKSAGISNDSIRTLTNVVLYGRLLMQERNSAVTFHLRERLLPIIISEFEQFERGSISKPVNYSRLSQSLVFINTIEMNRKIHEMYVLHLQSLLRRTKELMAELDRELLARED